MKRIKIINRTKFLRFIAIMCVIVGVVISLIINLININSKKLSFLDQFEQTKVTIRKGQTSWNIQKELSPSFDISQVLYFTEALNGRQMGEIEAGETLIFLKEK